ncbi:MAG: hydrolase [Alphaproteobacteria bacterium]|nr:hydrolase [Alphaproteobacteria bacterium]
MPMVQAEGGEIHYTRKGGGSPLVMLVPQSSGPVGIEPFVGKLSEAFTVYRYDQYGTGRSASLPTTGAMTMEARATEVVGLLDALDIEHAHLCCHSTGCGIGLAVVSVAPERVDGLTLVSPWEYADRQLTITQRLRIAAAEGLDPYHYACFNVGLLFPPAYRREHEAGFERMAAKAERAPQDAEQISHRLNAILSYDTRPLTPAVSCPTLVVSARDDQLMPAWHGRNIAERIPESRFIELEGGGHMIPETRGNELAAAIMAFLNT